jgi:hypothetical protein
LNTLTQTKNTRATSEQGKRLFGFIGAGGTAGTLLDGSDRFTYWPIRASKGGEMMAPGTVHDPIQIIDVRDLAVWMMKLAQERTTGYFNAVSPPRAFTMGDVIKASLHASQVAGAKATCRISLIVRLAQARESGSQLLDCKRSDRAWWRAHQMVQSQVCRTPARFAGKSHDW